MEVDEIIEKFRDYLEFDKKILNKLHHLKTKERNYLIVDFKELLAFDYDLTEVLSRDPEETLKCFVMACRNLNANLYLNFTVRIKGLPESQKVPINQIRASYIGSLVNVEGMVKRMSDVKGSITASKFECPSCFPKGTLVLTPKGYVPIEEADEVVCVSENFELTSQKTIIRDVGKKTNWLVHAENKENDWGNVQMSCSGDHKWFAFENGTTKVVQTKDLKEGQELYQINETQKLHNLWKREQYQKKNLFRKMQERLLQFIPIWWRTHEGRQQFDKNSLCGEETINNSDSQSNRQESQACKKKAFENANPSKNSIRATQNKFETKGIEAWKEMWRERIQTVSQRENILGMQKMRGVERKIYKAGFSGTPYQSKSFRQQIGEFNGSMSVTPLKITSVNKTAKDTQMFDLIVPRYNNFIVFPGIVTHNCGNILNLLQLDENRFTEPTKCGCGRKGKFRNISNEHVNAFSLSLEESSENSTRAVLSRIKILCKDPLTQANIERKIYQGVRVEVTGLVKELRIRNSRGTLTSKIDWYIEASYIVIHNDSFEDIVWEKKDIQEFKALSEKKNWLRELRNSIFYDVYGFDEECEAIILSMFGGVGQDRDGVDVRGEFHILLVGDPGSSKSAILKIAQKFAPKAQYVAGKSISGAGLTAAAVKDDLLGGWTCEAGAMVLCNGGLLCLDELDKMPDDDKSALHEPLEQQTVSFSKAGIQATFMAKTSVLAAANPKHGRYSDYDSIYSQIDLVPTLINRFDLLYPIKESKITKEDDYMIARKIMSRGTKTEDMSNVNYDRMFIRKYISYAKKINPDVPEGIQEWIAKKYQHLKEVKRRGESAGNQTIPITGRNVAGIRRLAEAVARSRLHTTVTEEDAEMAFAKLVHSLQQVGIDPDSGEITVENMTGKKVSQSDLLARIVRLIREETTKGEKKLMDGTELYAVLDSDGFDELDIDKAMDRLSKKGDIVMQKPNKYRLG